MKARVLAFFALTLLTARFQAEAAPAEYIFQGVDIAPAIEYYRGHLHELEREVAVYSWSTGKKPIDVSAAFQKSAGDFWMHFGQRQSDRNIFGVGLYAAADPVITRIFGGSGENWLLREFKLPRGFRIIDFEATDTDEEPLTKAAVTLARFGCSDPVLLASGGADLSYNCQALAREIFIQALGVEALIYTYGATHFGACDVNARLLQDKAFVILDGRKIEYVRYYDKNTRENFEDRRRLQTLFLRALKAENYKPQMYEALAASRKAFPAIHGEFFESLCADERCVLVRRLCKDMENCERTVVGGFGIPAEDMKFASGPPLLWRDLANQPTGASDAWLRENKFACDGRLPWR